jgi:hypothetical protein
MMMKNWRRFDLLIVDCLDEVDVDGVDVDVRLYCCSRLFIDFPRSIACSWRICHGKAQASDWSQKRREESIQGFRLQIPGLLEIKRNSGPHLATRPWT